jgi:hypothetical protein
MLCDFTLYETRQTRSCSCEWDFGARHKSYVWAQTSGQKTSELVEFSIVAVIGLPLHYAFLFYASR